MTRRLLLAFLVLSLAVLSLLVLPLGVANQRSERTDLLQQVERDAVAIASLTSDVLASTSTSMKASTIRRIEDYASKTGARVLVVDADGTSVVDTGESGASVELGRPFASRPEIAAALDGKVDSGERDSTTLGYPIVYVAVPVTRGGVSLGAVRISYPAKELQERITSYWYALGAVSLAVLGVASVISLLMARWIARPLESIAAVALDVGEGDLDARADDEHGPPEVRIVARRVNESIAALQRMLDDQRAFTADASHQLRTPLQALMLRLDNVLHELDSGDVSVARGDVERAAAEVDRLAALVEALLVLERADRGAAGEPETVDLAALVARRATAWSERATRRGVTLTTSVASGLAARAHALHVEQVLDNYVDNAIEHTPAGGGVRVEARESGTDDRVEVHVLDDGPGMSAADLELAFRRFHSSPDRPRATGNGGFGLGLSIVQRLVEVDGGHAWLTPREPRGLDAGVAYPRASSSASTMTFES